YLHTRDRRFLHTAEACAEFYIRHTPAGGVPPWDYDVGPGDPQYLDTSAAAIAASGLLQLSELAPHAALYSNMALRILQSLAAPPHLATDHAGWEGILRSGVYHIHKGLGVDESVMWGEYFFVEALHRALQIVPGPGNMVGGVAGVGQRGGGGSNNPWVGGWSPPAGTRTFVDLVISGFVDWVRPRSQARAINKLRNQQIRKEGESFM